MVYTNRWGPPLPQVFSSPDSHHRFTVMRLPRHDLPNDDIPRICQHVNSFPLTWSVVDIPTRLFRYNGHPDIPIGPPDMGLCHSLWCSMSFLSLGNPNYGIITACAIKQESKHISHPLPMSPNPLETSHHHVRAFSPYNVSCIFHSPFPQHLASLTRSLHSIR